MNRTVLHVDLNNFFASVECKYAPELKEKYMAVCGSVSDRHGVVLAKNQLAKEKGVKTGMTLGEAEKACPGIVFVEAHHERYIEWSKKAKDIYLRYTDRMESFGIDEAWLDVTHSRIFGDGVKIADDIRRAVKEELGLTVSVGVSFNKAFAKLGSDMKKPDATTVISEENFKKKIWGLPVGDLLFAGHSTVEKLGRIGIRTIGELAKADFDYISRYLGKAGENLWVYANGNDDSPVASIDEKEDIKSVGNSITSYRDLTDDEDVAVMLTSLCESVSERVMRYGVGKATTLSLSVRDDSLNWLTRQGKLQRPTVLADDFFAKAMELFHKNHDWSKNVRSLGVAVSDFVFEEQMFMDDNGDYDKKLQLSKAVNDIRHKYGDASVQKGIIYKDKRLTKAGFHGKSLPTSHE
ncbi:MAG: DNA polymerase IV [Clostridia bacterium]|nr:DNA polymerase IV [Clostridia bacterium]